MTIFERDFDALAVGERFVTEGRRIEEPDILAFAALTGDTHPQHVDPAWAGSSRFGEQIAHGLLVLSCASGLMPFDPERIVALRRVGDAVFKQPVMIGDTVHVEVEVTRHPADRRRERPGGVPLARAQPARADGHAGVGRAGLAARGGPRADTALAMLLDGKRLLVTGVLTRGSIAYSVAERAQQEGAEVVLTGFGRTRRMTERAAARLPSPPEVLELDVNSPDDLSALAVIAGTRRRRAARDRVRPRRRARRQLPLRPRPSPPSSPSGPRPIPSRRWPRRSPR